VHLVCSELKGATYIDVGDGIRISVTYNISYFVEKFKSVAIIFV